MVDAQPFRPANAPDIRTFAIAQMAVAMSADRTNPERPFREVRVQVGTSLGGSFRHRLTFASDTPDVAGAVVRGEIDLGTFNPSAYLTMACRGIGPFPEPLPLRAIGVMPSLDWMVFAVSERFGVSTLAEVRDRRVPLRVSVRARPADSTRFVVDQALGALGFSLADIEGWGGSMQLVDGPRDPARMQGIRDGSVDAVFDEGISGWGHLVLERGMRFLHLGTEVESRLSGLGWRLLPVSRDEFPEMREDAVGVSFSGWPLFTRADLADDLAYEMAKALDAARPIVPWDSETTVELRDLCVSTDAAPLDASLHPGAARYYRERGAL